MVVNPSITARSLDKGRFSTTPLTSATALLIVTGATENSNFIRSRSKLIVTTVSGIRASSSDLIFFRSDVAV